MKDQLQNARAISQGSIIFKRLRGYGPVSAGLRDALATIEGHAHHIRRGVDFVRSGDRIHSMYVVESGWAMRYVLTKDGRRQIVSIVLPGEIVGYESAMIGQATHTVAALTDMQVTEVRSDKVFDLVSRFPELIRVLAWRHDSEAARMEAQTMRLGRLSATHRMAHFMHELCLRLDQVDKVAENTFHFRMTQTELADALGLSLVHTNRQVQHFKRAGIFSISQGQITISDPERLKDIAENGDAPDLHAA